MDRVSFEWADGCERALREQQRGRPLGVLEQRWLARRRRGLPSSRLMYPESIRIIVGPGRCARPPGRSVANERPPGLSTDNSRCGALLLMRGSLPKPILPGAFRRPWPRPAVVT